MKKQSRRGETRQAGSARLDGVRRNVAGIDIGSRQMYVCGPEREDETHEIRVFDTTTAQIQNCLQWLKAEKVESVALESTGVYWIPVLEILEGGGLEAVLVDTRPLSRVPGRKTDVEDCQWLQTLHSHGLLQGSYRPSEEISQLRMIVRQKAALVREQSDWVRRMQKCLDQMNVRVHHAVSDVQGATGMAILRAIAGGERDPQQLAKLRDAGCRRTEAEIREFLTGNWRSDHLFNLEQSLLMYDAIGERIRAYEQEIQQRMQALTPPGRKEAQAPPPSSRNKRKSISQRKQEPKRQVLFRMAGVDLTTIDGIGVETAEVILSEYGADISKFPSEKEFVSHVQLIPNRPVSGGKVLKKRRKQKGTRTAEALRNAASTLRNSRSALGAYYRRMARLKDASIAIFATARKLGTLVYRMLRWGQRYVDQGQDAYQRQYEAVRVRSLISTAAQYGYKLVPAQA